MPDVKISALPASTTPLAGTEVLPIVQSATTRQVSVANLTAGRSVGGTNFIPSGSSVPTNGLYLPAANSLGFSTNSTNRATIDASGNLGLGTTPSAWGATAPAIEIPSFAISSLGNTGYLNSNSYFNTSNNFVYKNTAAATLLVMGTSGYQFNIAPSGTAGATISFTQAMTLDASGKLTVNATTPVDTTMIGTVYDGLNANGIGVNDATGASGSGLIKFLTLGTVRGSITNNANTGVLYNVTSDQRLKTNIVNAPIGNIDNIKVRSFDWIADGSHQEYGMVAQELIEVAPYAVNKHENPDEMMGVDYSKLVPMMIKEIQDLKQRITALENK